LNRSAARRPIKIPTARDPKKIKAKKEVASASFTPVTKKTVVILMTNTLVKVVKKVSQKLCNDADEQELHAREIHAREIQANEREEVS
tara:strand:+ start:3751 stop:4014 length:264 start_codon:yes stop_codon:yes gene_type:complete